MIDVGSTLLVVFVAQTLSWVGLPAVGTAALGSAGVLASQGKLSVWPLLVAGIAGAQVGGIIGWRLGRHLAAREAGRPHKDTRVAERARKAVDSGRELDQRYGGVMVLFVSSWISGTLGLPFRRFVVWNLVAATLWTVASVLGSYGIASVVLEGDFLDHPVALVIAAIAGVLLACAHLRRRRNQLIAREVRPV